MRRIVAAVLLLAASVVDTGTASAADPIYVDPSQPVPARVADMLRRMVSTLTARTFSPN
jgi:beta-glucosidase